MAVASFSGAFQPSMFDVDDEPAVLPLAGLVQRRELTRGAWVDLAKGWLSGADAVLERLLEHVPWRAERRTMWDKEVDVPRLLCWYGAQDRLPHPVLDDVRDLLNEHYAAELGERFVTAGLCLYRDGKDSVAWHGDRIGKGNNRDTMVAILSVGADRPLALRERGASSESLRVPVGHGDLIVMGGSCQRTWDHAIPKTARPVGPRVSIQFRPAGVA
jgi:alkylated DNA repair dioxygenase AlkB